MTTLRARLYGMAAESRARGRRPGFSLAEMLMAMGVFSILMIGIGAAVSIAVRAIDDGTSPSARTSKTSAAIAQMTAEVASATSFNTRSAHAVEFVVPDRTGDSVADTIRYDWTGKADDPVMRTLNGGTPVAITDGVGSFDLTYSSHSTVSHVTSTSTTSNAVTVASFSTWSGVAGTNVDYRLSSTSWLGEYILIDPLVMPSAGNTLSITKVTVSLRGVLLTPGTVSLGIYKAVGGAGSSHARPSTQIGSNATASLPLLSLVGDVIYNSTDFTFSDVQLGSTDQEIVLLFKASAACADIRYLNSSSAPADNHEAEWTSNSGSSWSPTSSQSNYNDLRFTVSGGQTVTTSSESLVSSYFEDVVGVSITPGSKGGDAVQTAIQVLGSPQVPTP